MDAGSIPVFAPYNIERGCPSDSEWYPAIDAAGPFSYLRVPKRCPMYS